MEEVKYTIEDFENNMTIYYRKATGAIKQVAGGIQDMSVFGDEESDYTLIWDFIIVPRDEYVRDNMNLFTVDVETKELIYTPLIDVSKYRMR